MRILMLGNSYIFTNDLPGQLAELTGAYVTHHTRGGARLAEQLNPATQLGAKTQEALETESWDYVVLQEMSNGPVTSRASFLRAAAALCGKIHEKNAMPVMYLTWPYKKNSPAMADSGLDYDGMYQALQDAYREAARLGDGLVADVGTVFYQADGVVDLYAPDGSHPNEAGTRVAAEILADTILTNWRQQRTDEKVKE